VSADFSGVIGLAAGFAVVEEAASESAMRKLLHGAAQVTGARGTAVSSRVGAL
jgi:hypothetical protein